MPGEKPPSDYPLTLDPQAIRQKMLVFDSQLNNMESRLLNDQDIPEEMIHALMESWKGFKKDYWSLIYLLEEQPALLQMQPKA